MSDESQASDPTPVESELVNDQNAGDVFQVDQHQLETAINNAVARALRGDPNLGQVGIVARVEGVEETQDEHDGRLSTLEGRWLVIIGATLGAGGLGGAVGAFLSRGVQAIAGGG